MTSDRVRTFFGSRTDGSGTSTLEASLTTSGGRPPVSRRPPQLPVVLQTNRQEDEAMWRSARHSRVKAPRTDQVAAFGPLDKSLSYLPPGRAPNVFGPGPSGPRPTTGQAVRRSCRHRSTSRRDTVCSASTSRGSWCFRVGAALGEMAYHRPTVRIIGKQGRQLLAALPALSTGWVCADRHPAVGDARAVDCSKTSRGKGAGTHGDPVRTLPRASVERASVAGASDRLEETGM